MTLYAVNISLTFPYPLQIVNAIMNVPLMPERRKKGAFLPIFGIFRATHAKTTRNVASIKLRHGPLRGICNRWIRVIYQPLRHPAQFGAGGIADGV